MPQGEQLCYKQAPAGTFLSPRVTIASPSIPRCPHSPEGCTGGPGASARRNANVGPDITLLAAMGARGRSCIHCPHHGTAHVASPQRQHRAGLKPHFPMALGSRSQQVPGRHWRAETHRMRCCGPTHLLDAAPQPEGTFHAPQSEFQHSGGNEFPCALSPLQHSGR